MPTQEALRPKVEPEKVDTGIEAPTTDELAKRLSEALADSYVLYLQTQGVHWNVVGPAFYGVHNLTEVQYQDLATAIDDIAERIRALGHVAPSSFGEFIKLSTLESTPNDNNAGELIEKLVRAHQSTAERMRESVAAAEAVEDVFTADLITARIGAHEKAAWMLRSILAQ